MKNYLLAKDLEKRNKIAITRNENLDKDLVKCAEEFLNIKFPKSYRCFLEEYGFCSFGGLEIYGVIDKDFSHSSIPDAIWLNSKNREDFQQPEHIFVLSDVGEGSYYALDLSQMNNNEECPVVIWPVGGYEMTPKLEIVAPDFGTWFLERVQFWGNLILEDRA